MTRSNAREIAVHFVFELSFSNDSAQQLLDCAMTRQTLSCWARKSLFTPSFPM